MIILLAVPIGTLMFAMLCRSLIRSEARQVFKEEWEKKHDKAGEL